MTRARKPLGTVKQKRGLQAWHKGRRAEWLCCLLLYVKGYRIIARRAKTPLGEIDLIAKRGSVIALIEVKTRPTEQQARESITPFQQKRILQAARYILAQNPTWAMRTIRCDAMLVIPRRMPIHIKNAWSF